jgi:hypothetical protein
MQIESGYHESEDGKTITLGVTFTREEWERFVLLLGMAAGVVRREDMNEVFWEGIRLINKIMEGNPHWHPFWTPEAQVKP